MMVAQEQNQDDQEDALGPLQIRLQEAQKVLRGEQTVIDALSNIAQNRQELLDSGLHTSGLLTGDFGKEPDFDLPDNVIVQDGAEPDQEALEIARKKASNHRRIMIAANGQVRGLNPDGGGGSVKLREAQIDDFTIDRRIEANPTEDGSTSFTNPVRSMSEAAGRK